MTALIRAVERRDWELVALLLALGAGRTLARLPRGTVEDLLALLEAEDND